METSRHSQDQTSPMGGKSFSAPLRGPAEAGSLALQWGIAGTTIAGGLFPTAIALLMLVDQAWGRPYPPAGFLLATLGGLFGVFIAGCTAVVMFMIAWVVQTLCGLHRFSTLIAAIVGGWTGFAANFSLTMSLVNEPTYVVLATAMLMGQAGGALTAVAARRRMAAGMDQVEHLVKNQIQLRQLFGVTTAVAVVAAILAGLPLTPYCKGAIGYGAALQAVTLGGWILMRRLWGRIVSCETIRIG